LLVRCIKLDETDGKSKKQQDNKLMLVERRV